MRQLGDCVCPKCGGLYWRKSAQWHVCATNTATNGESVATNANPEEIAEERHLGDPVHQAQEKKTSNRRSREAFNAYQREYMKTYRARKRA